MSSQTVAWIVFAVSFLVSAVVLGRVLISQRELDFLSGSSPTPEAGTEAAPAPAQVADAAPVEEAPEGESEEDEEEGAVDEEVLKESRVSMMTFLENSLLGLAKEGFKLDSINKFGCHLFLAGAAEACARAGDLGHKEFVGLLEQSVAVLGSKPDLARTFSEKYEEYLLQPKYADMFRSGGDAMDKFLAGDDSSVADDLSKAMGNWSKPASETIPKDAPITVLFTDIVGSTAMTQGRGDEGAQAIVRVHNQVVRDALRQHSGIEVKHTGDGIMARFATTSNAVESALTMQRALQAHNMSNTDLPVNVRIGINAGEPIQEEEDLFGTTVQLAARICDKSSPGKVMTSNVVRELCAGKNMRFDDCGQFQLKGIEGPVTLYSAEDG